MQKTSSKNKFNVCDKITGVDQLFYKRDVTLNKAQFYLYQSVIKGPTALSTKELKTIGEYKVRQMLNRKKALIYKVNLWKQELEIQIANNHIKEFFGNKESVAVLYLLGCNEINPHWISYATFYSLGVCQSMFIDKLIQWKFLPENFYEIA